MMKKVISTLLAGSLCAGLCMTPASAVAFSDTIGHPGETAIDTFASLGILYGYGDGRFDPDGSITRGDMCTILSRVFTFKEEAENTFADLDETKWYAKPILQLNAAGIIQGYGNGRMDPLATIPREQALVMIARAFHIEPYHADITLPYDDEASIANWAYSSIAALYIKGYLPFEKTLGAHDPFTRADTAIVLDRVIQDLGWESAGKALVNGVLVDLDLADMVPGASTEIKNPIVMVDPEPSQSPEPSDSPVEAPEPSDSPVETPEPSDAPVASPEPSEAPADPAPSESPVVVAKDPSAQPSDYIEPSYPYRPEDFVTGEEDGRIYYVGEDAIPVYGTDISSHQGEVDWEAVAADGMSFVMLRAGFRGYGAAGTLNRDSKFEENIKGAAAAGLQVGAYFFSQAITEEEAVEEAQFFLEILEPYRDLITLPVTYDWEDVGLTSARTYKLDNDTLNACALAFCGEVEKAGYESSIYFYPNLGKDQYDLDLLSIYPFWYCTIGRSFPDLTRPFLIWQYSHSGKIDGVEGDADMDIMFLPKA